MKISKIILIVLLLIFSLKGYAQEYLIIEEYWTKNSFNRIKRVDTRKIPEEISQTIDKSIKINGGIQKIIDSLNNFIEILPHINDRFNNYSPFGQKILLENKYIYWVKVQPREYYKFLLGFIIINNNLKIICFPIDFGGITEMLTVDELLKYILIFKKIESVQITYSYSDNKYFWKISTPFYKPILRFNKNQKKQINYYYNTDKNKLFKIERKIYDAYDLLYR